MRISTTDRSIHRGHREGGAPWSPRLRRVTALAVACTLLGAPAALADEVRDGPVEGMPPLQDAAVGWVETYGDPAYLESYLADALFEAHVNVPKPFDVVKPEAYLPNVVVPTGPVTSALPVAPVDLSGLTYSWRGRTKTIEEFVTTTRTDAVVLVHDGAVVGEWYANGYGPDVRHQPWSVTKTFVAAAVGVAHDQGLIGSLDDPIETYLPELAGTAWEGATIEQLLRMESGVHWDEDTPVLAVNTQVEQWVDLALDLYSQGALGATRNAFLAALPPAYEAGTEFRYNSGNTQVLAWLTEVLYDATFDQVLSDTVWAPMGAQADAVVTADRVGGVIASHGLFALPYDFARFGELLRNGGVTPEGERVLSQAWIDAMTTMTEVSDGRYGYQTWAHEIAGPGGYSASGFQGQKITVVPDDCLTGVRLSHAIGADVRDGDDPFDPDAYGFAIEFFAEEWQTMLRAVADELGPCATTASTTTDPTGDEAATADGEDAAARGGEGEPDDGSVDAPGGDVAAAPLPVTGGAPGVLALAALAAGAQLRRGARRTG